MTKVAFLFPGQGAQKVGMGKEFYQSSPEAKAVFEQADQVISGLSNVVFNGPEEELKLTKYAQPGILTTSIAALKAFQTHPKYKNIQPVYSAGLSLGEYSALAASGAMTLADTLKLVERRGAFMEQATKLAAGKMAAVIAFDKDQLTAICKETGAEVANFNSPEQIVITGHAATVEAAAEKIKAAGAKNVIMLEVSGAFHSSLMQPAADQFAAIVKDAPIQAHTIAVVTNVDGRAYTDPAEIRANLAKQITSSVQWVASIEFMIAQGVRDFIEIGPGRVLTGLVRRINSEVNRFNIEKPEDIEKLPF